MAAILRSVKATARDRACADYLATLLAACALLWLAIVVGVGALGCHEGPMACGPSAPAAAAAVSLLVDANAVLLIAAIVPALMGDWPPGSRATATLVAAGAVLVLALAGPQLAHPVPQGVQSAAPTQALWLLWAALAAAGLMALQLREAARLQRGQTELERELDRCLAQLAMKGDL